MFAADGGQVLEDQLGALRLPGPGLAADDDALVLPGPLHQGVAVVPDSEDVRRELSDLSLPVELDLLAGVDWEDLVGIDSNKDGPGEGLEIEKKLEYSQLCQMAAILGQSTHINKIVIVSN